VDREYDKTINMLAQNSGDEILSLRISLIRKEGSVFGTVDIRLICNLRIGFTGNSFTLRDFGMQMPAKKHARYIGGWPLASYYPSQPLAIATRAGTLPKHIAYCSVGRNHEITPKGERCTRGESVISFRCGAIKFARNFYQVP
jgi:hypothetical protein